MNYMDKCAKALKMKSEGYSVEAIAVNLSVTVEEAFAFTQGKIAKSKSGGKGSIPAGTIIHLPTHGVTKNE